MSSDLHDATMEKLAGGLSSMYRFGRQAARQASRAGSHFVLPKMYQPAPGKFMDPLLAFFRGSPTPEYTSSLSKIPKSFRGTAVNIAGLKTPPGGINYRTVGAPHMEDAFDKLKEMQVFRRAAQGDPELLAAIPESRNLAQYLGAANSRKAIERRLGRAFGGKYVVKPYGGYGSLGIETQMTDLDPANAARALRKDRKNWDKYLLQERRPMQNITTPEKWLDKAVTKMFYDNDPSYWFNRPSREFRVHSLGGKVLRGSTLGRGGNYLSAIFPFNTPKAKASEDLIQRLLDRLGKKHRDVSYGFDVGIGENGKPFIIEGNPAKRLRGKGAEGMSGLIDSPYNLDVLTSMLEGRRPGIEGLRRAAGTAAVGVPAAGLIGSQMLGGKDT